MKQWKREAVHQQSYIFMQPALPAGSFRKNLGNPKVPGWPQKSKAFALSTAKSIIPPSFTQPAIIQNAALPCSRRSGPAEILCSRQKGNAGPDLQPALHPIQRPTAAAAFRSPAGPRNRVQAAILSGQGAAVLCVAHGMAPRPSPSPPNSPPDRLNCAVDICSCFCRALHPGL